MILNFLSIYKNSPNVQMWITEVREKGARNNLSIT